ncbi:RNA polymerase sigma factor [Paractinoplanes atraurantiacus]|uniref:RNA polymerase sigma-70 factor, ECF subfamily n=1 Tax=Paractinoplanes atraurantiacus TaxID=1036182 RepID=A0A285JG33_9ACTN|nr:RNA polymerase sigma factor [Actinoplanes atraurantiacus]SNY58346.1 RNA polymerase sigma-70 factor, ECF subfamily [Actinoplanes atraurantiacus]
MSTWSAEPSTAWSESSVAARDTEFSLFYEDEFARLVAFLIVQGAAPCLAADVAQEAMIAVYREWDVVEWPKTWVRRVAQRQWWRMRERATQEIPYDDLPEASGLLPPAEAEAILTHHEFLTEIAALSPQQRAVLAWTYDGYRPTEIAPLLNMNPATVRTTLRDARAAIQSRRT